MPMLDVDREVDHDDDDIPLKTLSSSNFETTTTTTTTTPTSSSCCSRSTYNLLAMSISFFLLFSGFRTAQNFGTKLLPGSMGSVSLATGYAVFAFSNFMAPMFVRQYGPRIAMAIASVGYLLYVVSLIYIVIPISILCAVLMGFGSAIIWTAQGVFLTENCHPSKRGTHSGVFWAIFQMSSFPGSIASFFLLTSNVNPTLHSENSWILGWNGDTSVLFLAMSICCFSGFCCFFLIRPPANAKVVVATSSVNKFKSLFILSDVIKQLKTSFKFLKERRFALLCPLLFYTGHGITYWAGWFSRQQHRRFIGLCYLGLIVVEVVAGLALGRVSDRVGRTPIILLGACAQFLALGLSWVGNDVIEADPSDISIYSMRYFFYAAPLLGLADCAMQTQLMIQLSHEYADRSAEAFAISKFIQALGQTIGFFATPAFGTAKADVFNFRLEIGYTGLSLIIGLIAYMILVIWFPKK